MTNGAFYVMINTNASPPKRVANPAPRFFAHPIPTTV
jgi:hypothetical protein